MLCKVYHISKEEADNTKAMPKWQDTSVTHAGFVSSFPGLLTTPRLPTAPDVALPYFAEYSGVFGIQEAGVLRFQLKCTGPCKLYIAGVPHPETKYMNNRDYAGARRVRKDPDDASPDDATQATGLHCHRKGIKASAGHQRCVVRAIDSST